MLKPSGGNCAVLPKGFGRSAHFLGRAAFCVPQKVRGPGGRKPAETAGDTLCYEMGAKGGVFTMRCCAPGGPGLLGLLSGGVLAAGFKAVLWLFAVFCSRSASFAPYKR